ncbi:MAG TPA: AbrB/MazE/SpoVT family DNA-binding domain-containing protein [Stellaceae bacterium]|jgi:AbrB family looped-hinge helix DNA binding protein|nr:AbrB/MazE/SpoVT family DNA-binding domain-containing protein [Stellaceae bacterium]
MNIFHAKVSESGRLSLPAEFRKAVGLDRGGDVVVELEGNVIRIRPLREVIAEAQALTRKLLGDRVGTSVDDFIAERRREAAEEEAKVKAGEKK